MNAVVLLLYKIIESVINVFLTVTRSLFICFFAAPRTCSNVHLGSVLLLFLCNLSHFPAFPALLTIPLSSLHSSVKEASMQTSSTHL